MKGSVDLYALPLSPPSRSVHLLLNILGVEYNYIEVDVLGGGTRTPEFLAMNPQHTVPVLKHGDFPVSESRAILVYICQVFKAGDKFYPSRDPKTKAVINQRMNFDLGLLYRKIGDAVTPVCFGIRNDIPEQERNSVDVVMQDTDQYLAKSKYFGGENLSLADFSLLASITVYEACEKGLKPLSNYPNIENWLNTMKTELPGYAEIGQPGVDAYKAWFETSFHDDTQNVINVFNIDADIAKKMQHTSVDLYALPLSPPSRSVHLLLTKLGVQHKYIEVDVLGGETRTDEFLAMNPQHTVPVLKHGDFAISESRAILIYICHAFLNGDKLYPENDPKAIAIINQRLNFDLGILYRKIGDAVTPVCFGLKNDVPEKERNSVDEAMKDTEDYLSKSKYFGGDDLSLADFSLLASITVYEACEKGLTPLSEYPNIEKWLNTMKTELPSYTEIGQPGVDAYRAWFETSYKPSTQDSV